MNHLRFSTLAGFLALAATGASAQEVPSSYEFIDETQHANVFVGLVETDRGTLELGPESGIAYGGRYGIRLSGPFVIEGQVALFPTSRAVQDTVISATDTTVVATGAEADMTLGIVSAALRFDITGARTWNRLLPFALLGVGAAFTLTDEDGVDSDVASDVRYEFGTRLLGELGLGAEWFATDRLALRLDARNMLWRIDAPLGMQLLDAPNAEWVQNFLLSAGVSFRF